MADVETKESQKTVVVFVVGLLIGGMLVWAFSGPEEVKKEESSEETVISEMQLEQPEEESPAADSLSIGEADIEIADQAAGMTVALSGKTFPIEEGWVAVRDYQNDTEGYVLGAARFSQKDALNPAQIVLLRPTVAGQKYAISLYKDNGDGAWGSDEKLDGIFGTFTAK